MKYIEELIRSIEYLAKDERTIFLGQSVKYSGNAIYNTLKSINDSKKIETPVFEEVQMGLSTGLALNGFIPITCYPRFDFLILACNQLVNHLDKMEYMSKGKMKPRVIIRTSIGAKEPLDGGPQHTSDYTEAFKKMLTNVKVVRSVDKYLDAEAVRVVKLLPYTTAGKQRGKPVKVMFTVPINFTLN